MQSPTLDGAVDRIGPLHMAYSDLEPGTMWAAQQLTNARRTESNKEKRDWLRRGVYWAYNSSLYGMNDGGKVPLLYQGTGSLIFDNLEEAVRQLRTTGFYRPTREEDIDAFKRAKDTLTLELMELGLKRFSDDEDMFCYNINTLKGRQGLNSAQAALAEVPYGPQAVFDENMRMFYDAKIKEILIAVLNPARVKELAAHRPVARIGRMLPFNTESLGSSFAAYGYLVDETGDSVRGLPRKSA